MSSGKPQQIGPYRVIDLLGEGGMGVIYRARDERNDREVALKTVDVPHEGYYNSLRREIRALAAIDHPGVVTILDEGVDRGVPWYAMELVSGPTLRAFRNRLAGVPDDAGRLAGQPAWWTQTLESLRTPSDVALPPKVAPTPGSAPETVCLGPRSLRRVVRVLLRLCETLAVVHAAGIVHADLKPENVLVGPADRPVLVDFGLTARFVGPDGREALDARLPAGGSFAYMAPEQIRGELFDARADLYAFALLMFEMIAGRPAFPAANPHELILAQVALDPPPLSSLVEHLPSELDALVDRLLAKEPRFRLGHASIIAGELAEIAGEPLDLSHLPAPHLYRPALSGRHGELRQLATRVRELREGRGGLLVISGESGVGKTRLAAELATRVRSQGTLLLSGEPAATLGHRLAPVGGALGPLRPVMTALADRCRQGGAAKTAALLGDRGPVLAEVFGSLAELADERVASGAGRDQALGRGSEGRPGELSGDGARLRLFHAVLDTLVALSEEDGAVIVLLDDVHLADELTQELLRFLAGSRYLEARRVLVVGTCRVGRLGPDLGSLLCDGIEALHLERLDEESVADLAADMLGLGEAPANLAQRLHGLTRGNPLFVTELLRAAVAEGALTRDAEGRWQIDESLGSEQTPWPLNPSIRDLMRKRLARLAPAERRLVTAAAVLGRAATLGLLAATADVDPNEAMSAARRLVQAELLTSDGATYEIAHAVLGELIYEQEPSPADYHRRAVGCIERQKYNRTDIDSLAGEPAEDAEIGDHLMRGGLPQRARPFLLKAARAAVRRGARREAERLYDLYLTASAGAPAKTAVSARLELSRDVLSVAGRLAESIACAAAALREAEVLRDVRRQVSARCQLSSDYQVFGKATEALSHAEQALELASRLDEPVLEARVYNRLATLALRRGAYEKARQWGDRALALAEEAGQRTLRGDTHALLGVLARARGDLLAAESHGREAVALHSGGQDPIRLAISQAQLGRALDELGRATEAQDVLRDALERFRRVGDRRWEAIVRGHLAGVLGTEGQLEEAAAELEGAAALLAEIGDRRSRAVQLLSLGWMHERQGRLTRAEGLYQEALAAFRALDDPTHTPLALCRLARVGRRQGRAIDAVEPLLDEAEAFMAQGGTSLERAVCLCERGHLRLIENRPAHEWLERARSEARERHATSTPHVVAALDRLALAVAARDAGHELRYGESVAES